MSKVGSLEDKICELIVQETDCNHAVKGVAQFADDQLPIAMVACNDFDIIYHDINGRIDYEGEAYVMIDGQSFEQVQTILEEIVNLFLLEPSFQALVTLGIEDMRPFRMLPALNSESNISFWRGAVHYNIKYHTVYDTSVSP